MYGSQENSFPYWYIFYLVGEKGLFFKGDCVRIDVREMFCAGVISITPDADSAVKAQAL